MVRFATEDDLVQVNELRKQVNDVHVEGRPDIFRGGFGQELQDHIFAFQNEEDRAIIVAERDGVIRGIGRALFMFMQEDAKARGFTRIELNMWEFNEGALAFYEALGFTTYRRYMELNV